jgi:hypothetical protein
VTRLGIEVTMIVAACASIALCNGCSHQQSGAKMDMAVVASSMAGCYSLSLSTDQLGPDRLFPRPPNAVRLSVEHDPKGIREGYSLRGPLSGNEATVRGTGVWTPKSPDELVIYWGFEMTGTSISLRGNGGQYWGTASSYSEVPIDTVTANAVLSRRPCM